MSNDDMQRRLERHLREGFDDKAPRADVAGIAVDRMRRRQRRRQLAAMTGSLALVVLLMTVALPRLLSSEEPQVLLTNPPPAPTSPPTPTPGQTADPTESEAVSDAPLILLSNGDAIGIRTGTGGLVETLIIVPPEQIETRLGAVAVRSGSTSDTLVFAYEQQSEGGSAVIVATRGGDRRLREQTLPGLADSVNGLARLDQSPVFGDDGTLFWLLHGPDGLPALGVATVDDDGLVIALTGDEGIPLPLPELPSEQIEDIHFELDLALPPAAGDVEGLGSVIVSAEHAVGTELPTTRFSVQVAPGEGTTAVIVAGPDPLDVVGVDGQPIVDSAGGGSQRWTLVGRPCQTAGCEADPSARYRVALDDRITASLPEAYDRTSAAEAPQLTAFGDDVLITGRSATGAYAPVHRVSPDGRVVALPFTAVSVDAIGTASGTR